MLKRNSGALALAPSGDYAFIAQYAASFFGSPVINQISSCPVSSGALGTCSDSGGTGFDGALGLVITPDGNYALVTNLNTNIVLKCSVAGNALSSCVDSGVGAIFNHPVGITLNAAGTIAFIVNSGNNTISKCTVSSGSLSACTTTGS